MHTDAYAIDDELVRTLIAGQMPHWAHLPLQRVVSSGTDNVMYRLGDALLVRLPMRPSAVAQIAKEYRFLPYLASQVPLAIHQPLALGQGTADFPAQWAVYRWMPGENAWDAPVMSLCDTAGALADFVRALWRTPMVDPVPYALPPYGRGVALAQRRDITARAFVDVAELIDTSVLQGIWQAALGAPAWREAPVWVHGDIQPSNLLVCDGNLCAVIDFGTLAVGDPAVDLMVAWNYLDAPARQLFRARVAVDDATWLRGKGWALSVALLQLPYYLHTNPVMVAQSRRVLQAVIDD